MIRARRVYEVSDPPADPFGENVRGLRALHFRLLGMDFVFEIQHPAVERLVKRAFENLPRHRLGKQAGTLRVRMVLRQRRASRRATPPAPRFAGGAGLITATVDADNFAVLAPRQGSALVVLSSDMLRHDYHLRYELLEFAVITLAVRAAGLLPLHAACVALDGRAALLLGHSRAGKSTLSLQAAAAGLQLVSEDSLFVAPRRLRAAGLPNYLYVRSGTPARLLPAGMARELARARTIRRRSGVRKRELDLRRTRLAVAADAPRIAALILLTPRRARGGKMLIPQSADRAVARLRAMQAYAAALPGWADFARKVARLPCFEMRRGAHPAEAAAVVEALLRDLPRNR